MICNWVKWCIITSTSHVKTLFIVSISKFEYCLDKTFIACMFAKEEKNTTQIGATCKYTGYIYRVGRRSIHNEKQNTRKKIN